MDDQECPLSLWFDRTGEKKLEWADRNLISRGTLFEVLGGKRSDHSISTLMKIEAGTGGQVSVRAMIEWLTRLKTKETT